MIGLVAAAGLTSLSLGDETMRDVRALAEPFIEAADQSERSRKAVGAHVHPF